MTLNYYALEEALRNWLGPHDLKLLRRVSAQFYSCFKKEYIFTIHERAIDAIKHNCKKCDRIYYKSMSNENYALCICSSGRARHFIKISGTKLNADMFNAIIKLDNKYEMMKEIIQFMSLTTIGSLIDEILDKCCNKEILKSIIPKLSDIEPCLFKMCEYEMDKEIERYDHYIKDCKLIEQCIHITPNTDIKNILLNRYIELGNECLFDVEWIKEHGSQKIIRRYYTGRKDFMEAYYRVDLETCICEEWMDVDMNLLSIKFAEKYNRRYFWTDYLSNDQKVQLLYNLSGIRIKYMIKTLDEGTLIDDSFILNNKKLLMIF